MEPYEYMPRQMAMRHNLVNRSTPVRPSMPEVMSPFPEKTPIGMAYVPMQEWSSLYESNNALVRGTAFPELDFPFGGGV